MKVIIFLLILCFTTSAFAQGKDSMHLIYRPVISYKIRINDKTISLAKAMKLMENHPEAYEEMRKARRNAFGQYFLAAGSALLAIPVLNKFIIKEEMNSIPYLISGGALVVAGFPFTNAYFKHAQKSVELYNSAL